MPPVNSLGLGTTDFIQLRRIADFTWITKLQCPANKGVREQMSVSSLLEEQAYTKKKKKKKEAEWLLYN